MTGTMTADLEATPEDEAVDADDADTEAEQGLEIEDDGYWLDEGYRLRARLFVPCHVELFTVPVPAGDVAAIAGLGNLEVLRQPQMSNPLWVSKEELSLLEPLLPAWPALPPEAPHSVTVSGSGSGYGDPDTNIIVEHAAMTAVTKHYRERGWSVDDVSGQNLGWDLDCRSPAAVVERVEVKGISGRRPTVLLAANEIRAARVEHGWRAAVVTRALTAPSIRFHDAAEVLEAAHPYVYRARLSE